MGFCFDCVECESVIVNGLTMFEEEIPKVEGVSISMSKLYYILKKYGLAKQEIEKMEKNTTTKHTEQNKTK